MTYLIKTEIGDIRAKNFIFSSQKTMYGGRRIAVDGVIYLFASENEGGPGLIARGLVTAASPTPRKPGVLRQTPRVTIEVRVQARSERRMGRSDLKPFTNWSDGRPETELNFKFYRQATNKIGGISPAAAAFLDRCFRRISAKKKRLRAT